MEYSNGHWQPGQMNSCSLCEGKCYLRPEGNGSDIKGQGQPGLNMPFSESILSEEIYASSFSVKAEILLHMSAMPYKLFLFLR